MGFLEFLYYTKTLEASYFDFVLVVLVVLVHVFVLLASYRLMPVMH